MRFGGFGVSGMVALSVLLVGCGSSAPPLPTHPSQVQQRALPSAGISVPPTLSLAGLSASAASEGTPAQNAADGSLSTWWSANGGGQYLTLKLGGRFTVSAVQLAFYRGDLRRASFDVLVSEDNVTWQLALSGVSSGASLERQRFAFTPVSARFVRIVNQGNTENSAAAYTEVGVEGRPAPDASEPGTPEPTPPGADEPTTPYTQAYFVDCVDGDDAGKGDSAANAWKSLRRAGGAQLQPGQALLFKRGCSWDGQLNARWNGRAGAPVIIGAYGSGELPHIRTVGDQEIAVRVTGSEQVIEHLAPVVGNRPPPAPGAVRCPGQSAGWRVGFSFEGSGNVVQRSSAGHFTAGVRFAQGSANKALDNVLTDNDIMSVNTPPTQASGDDNGAWGVLINADGNEVARNVLSGNLACSEDHGTEGASVEIHGGSDNFIHHNRSVNDGTFSELSGTPAHPSERNTYAYNLFAPLNAASQRAGEFLVLRGWASPQGASVGTRALNNTAYNVQVGVACFDGCGADVLDLENNVVIGAQKPRKSEFWSDAYAGSGASESHNFFGRIGSAPSYHNPAPRAVSTHLLTADETARLFVDPAGLNFQLAGPPVDVGAY